MDTIRRKDVKGIIILVSLSISSLSIYSSRCAARVCEEKLANSPYARKVLQSQYYI